MIYLYKLLENRAFGKHVCPVSQQVQEFAIFQQCMHIVFILQCQKAQNRTTAKLSKKAETSIVPIVFDDVLYEFCTYPVTVAYRRAT